MFPHIVPNGDNALLIYWGDTINEQTLQRVTACCLVLEKIKAKSFQGIIECVPAYTSVMVHFDVLVTDFFTLKQQLLAQLNTLPRQELPLLPVVEVPVCYHESLGFDLHSLAAFCRLSVDEVIHIHTSTTYLVYMLGFMPGFLYLGGLDSRLQMPRQQTPRSCIPAGSVGIAGQQTGIYPLDSPGGWQIIGRTPLRLFDQNNTPPVIASPWQKLRFKPISLDEFKRLEAMGEPKKIQGASDHKAINTITVRKPGLLTSLQDTGRTGLLCHGLPAAGCMDNYSQQLANWLVGNPLQQAVLEVTMLGPELHFNALATVGIAGADFEVSINAQRVDTSTSLLLKAGDILQFGRLNSGCRAYIAIAGGMCAQTVLGSESTYMPAKLGGFSGRSLQAGDQLVFNSNLPLDKSRAIPKALHIRYGHHLTLRVVEGAEFDKFTPCSQQLLFNGGFKVSSQSNRMGYRLNNEDSGAPVLALHTIDEMITTGLIPASVQVTPEGEAIIAMKDAQTSGGYPRIANIISADQHLLGQLKSGDVVRFYKVSLQQAISVYRQKHHWIQQTLS